MQMKKIFFLEDDISLINGLNFALQKQGYEVTNVRTIAEAKRLCSMIIKVIFIKSFFSSK